ncbi:unnamed protein product, partial [Meganyctiphanes norvegica]
HSLRQHWAHMGSSGEGPLLLTDEMRVTLQFTTLKIGLMPCHSGRCWNIQNVNKHSWSTADPFRFFFVINRLTGRGSELTQLPYYIKNKTPVTFRCFLLNQNII